VVFIDIEVPGYSMLPFVQVGINVADFTLSLTSPSSSSQRACVKNGNPPRHCERSAAIHPVIASAARQSTSSLRAQRGNPWMASSLAMTAHSSLRSQRGNP
jgi:hypothetical protein